MEKLLELREELDVIDKQIVELYEKRMTICEEVGKYKIETGRKVFDKQREIEKLAAVTANAKNEFNKKGITELFELIMSMSRKLQYQLLPKKDVEEGATTRISIYFETSNESGALYHLLSHFAYNDLNMIKIESRPIEGCDLECGFFIEFEGNMADESVKNAIQGLQEETRNLLITF